METILYILAMTVQLFLSAVSSCMFLTVILQFFVNRETNKAYRFFNAVSEVFVYPFRVIMARFHILEGTPLDVPFFVAYITISILTMLLPAL